MNSAPGRFKHTEARWAAAQALDEKWYIAAFHNLLGLACAALGDVHTAIGYYKQALAISREIGDRRGEGADRANMGLAHKELGNLPQARAYWQAALAIYRAIEDPHAGRVQGWLDELEKGT